MVQAAIVESAPAIQSGIVLDRGACLSAYGGIAAGSE